jgi:hypothetical protein
MNSLPLISHRMFVAALGNEGRLHTAPSANAHASPETGALERAIPLEVLDWTQPLPSDQTRRLRLSATGGPM